MFYQMLKKILLFMEDLQNKNDVLIIAEAGVNHNGDFNMALELIDQASLAGAHYIKFQTFKASKITTLNAKKSEYQLKNQSIDETQYEMLKSLEIPLNWYPKLIDCCKKKNIKFLSTGFDIDSIDFLDKLNMPLYKIPSGEITHKKLLKHIASKKKNIILSTGMAEMSEINDAINVLTSEGINKEQITVLHCSTQYPTPLEDVNLLAMLDIKKRLNLKKVGYSDHTQGIEVPIAAVSLGAKVIEKHITLNKNLPGPDHKASLDPTEFKKMVEGIKSVSIALSGSGIKEPNSAELKNKNSIRKSLHYQDKLMIGTKLEERHFIALRPGDGVSPMQIDLFIGKRLKCDTDIYQKCNLNDIK